MKPEESDWKKYSAMVQHLRERYLAEKNAVIASMLTDSKKTETERFWDTLEVMEKEAAALQRCLGDHSRSKMVLSLITMRSVGMLKKEDLADFSAELQKQVLDESFGKRG